MRVGKSTMEAGMKVSGDRVGSGEVKVIRIGVLGLKSKNLRYLV